jgi:2-hydroxy-3-keto-5-methylthiopentenyl-1-phosphate phosphatase
MTKQPWAVYCDFDGTVTSIDCVDFLLNRLALPEWRLVEAMWEKGLITSRECMKRQIPLIQGGWGAIRECLDEVEITPGFVEFSHWCRRQKIPLYIVSEGLDRVIHAVLERLDVQVDGVFSNRLEGQDELILTFPFSPKNDVCNLGMCKCQVLEKPFASSQGIPGQPYRIVIGDGASDYCWAAQADLLFAQKKLKTFCEQLQVPFIPFQDFSDIQNHLQELLQRNLLGAAVPA